MFNSRSTSPFTATQWQELEHQALIYKYIVSGVPIPPELLYSVKTSLDSSLSSTFFPNQPIGWGWFQVGFGRKEDPEPGRCRRTDGKKWRCSKEAHPDSKYCEKHMHRGRNRSRKPVEQLSVLANPCSIPSTNNNITSSSNSYSSSPLLSRPPGSTFSLQTNATHNSFLDSSGSYSHPERDNRYCQGTRDGMDERAFFPEVSGNVRNLQESYEHLTMSSYNGYNSQPQFHALVDTSKQYEQEEQNNSFVLGADFKSQTSRPIKLEKDFDDTHKPMHHFLGDHQWPPKNTDSWLDLASTSSRTIHSDS